MTEPYASLRAGAEIYRNSFAIIRAESDLARFRGHEEKVAVREEDGLVTKRPHGRERIVRGNPERLAQARGLLQQLEQRWVSRIRQLDALLAEPRLPKE